MEKNINKIETQITFTERMKTKCVLIITLIIPFIIWSYFFIITEITERCDINIIGYTINIFIIFLVFIILIFILLIFNDPNINKIFYLLFFLLLVLITILIFLIWLLITIDLSQKSDINVYKILGLQITKVNWYPHELENIYIEYINKLDKVLNLTKNTKDELYKILKTSSNPETMKEKINLKLQAIIIENNSWSHYIKTNLPQILIAIGVGSIIAFPFLYWGIPFFIGMFKTNTMPLSQIVQTSDIIKNLNKEEAIAMLHKKILDIELTYKDVNESAIKETCGVIKDLLKQHDGLHKILLTQCNLSNEAKTQLFKFLKLDEAQLNKEIFQNVGNIGVGPVLGNISDTLAYHEAADKLGQAEAENAIHAASINQFRPDFQVVVSNANDQRVVEAHTVMQEILAKPIHVPRKDILTSIYNDLQADKILKSMPKELLVHPIKHDISNTISPDNAEYFFSLFI